MEKDFNDTMEIKALGNEELIEAMLEKEKGEVDDFLRLKEEVEGRMQPASARAVLLAAKEILAKTLEKNPAKIVTMLGREEAKELADVLADLRKYYEEKHQGKVKAANESGDNIEFLAKGHGLKKGDKIKIDGTYGNGEYTVEETF